MLYAAIGLCIGLFLGLIIGYFYSQYASYLAEIDYKLNVIKEEVYTLVAKFERLMVNF